MKQWSGNSNMTTRPFEVDEPWEIQWTSGNDYFSIELYGQDGKRLELIANQSKSGASSNYEPRGGTFFLKIEASDTWTIKVVRIKTTNPISPPPAVSTSNNVRPANPVVPPETKNDTNEEGFLDAIRAAIKQYDGGQNEMETGAAGPVLAKALCVVLPPSRRVQNWVGTVYKLTTNGDGKGVVSIKIDDDVYVQTWNNALSDIGSDTLIDPGSVLFSQAVKLRVGEKVHFNGQFLPSETDCVREQSMTLRGSIKEPEFSMRFESISPAN